jgi:hypothetical protein
MNELAELRFLNFHALRRQELVVARARMDKLIERETGAKPSTNITAWIYMMLDSH